MDNLDKRLNNNDFIDALPFSRNLIDDLVEVGGGNVQRTFVSEKYGVIHTTPIDSIKDENISLISNRWIIKDKAQALARIQELVPKTAIIDIPQVKVVGSFEFNGQLYLFWLEDYIKGDTLLDRTFTSELYQDYEDIIGWSAMLHQNTETQELLRDYYIGRIHAFRTIFGSNSELTGLVGEDFSNQILNILEELESLISITIDLSERVSTIHGDLRSKNIIFTHDHKAIIDFEQGVNGGDWFYDIEKLLMLMNNESPNIEKPFTYRPPLNRDQKIQLVTQYLNYREGQGWQIPQFILDYIHGDFTQLFILRKRIFDIDNDLSQLVHSFARGWNFFTRQGQFHEQKGLLYLRDKFIRDYLN